MVLHMQSDTSSLSALVSKSREGVYHYLNSTPVDTNYPPKSNLPSTSPYLLNVQRLERPLDFMEVELGELFFSCQRGADLRIPLN